MAQIIGGLLAKAIPALGVPLIGGITGGFAVGFLVQTAITSYAMKRLQERQQGGLGSQLANTRTEIGHAQYIYGKTRVGGHVVYRETTDNNRYLHEFIVFANHEIEAFDEIYVDNLSVTMDGNGNVTQSRWDDSLQIFTLDGSQTTAQTNFQNRTENGSIDSTFIGEGVAYLYVRYDIKDKQMRGGIPEITATISGKKVYDPRTASTAYSANAALVISDFLEVAYGSDAKVPDATLTAEANVCDTSVSLSAGGTENQYEINGAFRMSEDPQSVMDNMLAACGGSIYEMQGNVLLRVGSYVAPTVTLTDDDVRSAIEVQGRHNWADLFNGVKGTFHDSGTRYIKTEFDLRQPSGFLTEDNNESNIVDIHFPFITSHAMAQRVAKMLLYRQREQISVRATFGSAALGLVPGEVVNLTLDKYGFSSKTFEVKEYELIIDPDVGLQVSLLMQETSSAAFSWSSDEAAIISNNTTLTSGVLDAPTGLAVVDGSYTAADGTRVPALDVSWTNSVDARAVEHEVQYKQSTDSTWNSLFSASAESMTIGPLATGVTWEVQVRALGPAGEQSEFTSTSSLLLGAKTTALSAPTAGSVSTNTQTNSLAIAWTDPTDNDFSHANIYRHTANTFGSASKIGTSQNGNFQDPHVNTGTQYYYWVTAVDYSGNESTELAAGNATVPKVDTDWIEDNAVTVINSTSVGTFTTSSTSWQTAATLSFSATAGTELIVVTSFQFVFRMNDIGDGCQWRWRRNGTTTVTDFDFSPVGNSGDYTIFCSPTEKVTAAVTETWVLQIRNGTAGTVGIDVAVKDLVMYALEAKK